MRIGIDSGALAGPKVGVYQTTLHLIEELKKLDKNNQYFLFFPPRLRLGWRYLALPIAIWLKKIDLYIGPSQALPYFCPCPSIIVIHDLAYEHYPKCYPDSYKKLRGLTLHSAKKATKIIAVSEATKKDLIEIYKVPAEKISVVYEGVSPIFKPAKKSKAKTYFLYVGALKRIKNIPTLLKAFKIFLKKNKYFKLILAGGDYWPDPEIQKIIKKLKLEEHIERLGFVNNKHLVKLYQEATAFVSPALYEGFGLPLVEAMASGCPVIAGNTGAQPEIVGKAGMLVDPRNENTLAKAMVDLVNKPAFRQKLISAGLNQAKKFSWKNFAENVYEKGVLLGRKTP